MTYKDFIEALTILSNYESTGLASSLNMSAEHDIIYIGPDPDEVSEEDTRRLEELGFLADENSECFSRFV